MSTYFWEITSSIDLEKFLQDHPPGFKYKIDHFYYIIDYNMKYSDYSNCAIIRKSELKKYYLKIMLQMLNYAFSMKIGQKHMVIIVKQQMNGFGDSILIERDGFLESLESIVAY